jgi:hypothetical protein
MKRRKTFMDTLIMVLTLFGFIAIGLVIGDKIRNRRRK